MFAQKIQTELIPLNGDSEKINGVLKSYSHNKKILANYKVYDYHIIIFADYSMLTIKLVLEKHVYESLSIDQAKQFLKKLVENNLKDFSKTIRSYL